MKKAIFTFLALLIAVPKSHAIEPIPEQEISFQYSTITAPQFINFFVGAFSSALSLGTFTIDDMKCTGLFSVQYHHAVSKRIMLGCTTGYEYASLVLKDKDGAIRDGSIGQHYVSILPSAKLYYNYNQHFGMYGKLQAGILMQMDKSRVENDEVVDEFQMNPSFSFHVVPFGCEFGGESIRGYAEVGWGYQGLITIGIKKSF